MVLREVFDVERARNERLGTTVRSNINNRKHTADDTERPAYVKACARFRDVAAHKTKQTRRQLRSKHTCGFFQPRGRLFGFD